jgi:hypothetical protein
VHLALGMEHTLAQRQTRDEAPCRLAQPLSGPTPATHSTAAPEESEAAPRTLRSGGLGLGADDSRPRLEGLSGGCAGHLLDLDRGSLLIGRHPVNDLTLQEPTVSRVHAWIHRVNGVDCVEDLGSRHGTFVCGRRVDRAPLREGDWVRFGLRASFRYSRVGTAREAQSCDSTLVPESHERLAGAACDLKGLYQMVVAGGVR